jgi:hypothetical protein
VRFENASNATAPAQEVIIQSTLDADLDPSSFQFGDLGFGATQITVPAGSQSFQTSIDVRSPEGSSLRLDVSAKFDPASMVATWSMRATDPATGKLPDDPFAGFLPPNDSAHSGEGFVKFTVDARNDVDAGTRIDSSALITFDTNPPMATNRLWNSVT